MEKSNTLKTSRRQIWIARDECDGAEVYIYNERPVYNAVRQQYEVGEGEDADLSQVERNIYNLERGDIIEFVEPPLWNNSIQTPIEDSHIICRYNYRSDTHYLFGIYKKGVIHYEIPFIGTGEISIDHIDEWKYVD